MEPSEIKGLQRPVGVWRAVFALGNYRLKDALWPEVTLALLIGGGGAALIVRGTTVTERVNSMGDLLTLAAAFLAVIFAALAIVVSLPSTSYLRMLAETDDLGMRKFLDPFLVAVGVQVLIVMLAIGFRFVGSDVPWQIEHAVFYFVGFLFIFGLLDIAGLARQLVRHGVLRAADAALNEGGEKPRDVTQLPDRRTR